MKKIIFSILALLLIATLLWVAVDFFRFPECYITTWKYQLERDVANGCETAVEYYENAYIANGRILFEKGGAE